MSLSAAVVAARSVIYVGMDVHKESITLAVLPTEAAAPTRVDRLPNDVAKLKRFFDRLAERGELRACYEASGAGYVLHRALRDWGYACDVIAPSLIPKRPGFQRTTARRGFGFREGTIARRICGGCSILTTESGLSTSEPCSLRKSMSAR